MCPPIGPRLDFYSMVLAIPPEQRAAKLADVLRLIETAPWRSEERALLLGFAHALDISMLASPAPMLGGPASWMLGA